MTDDAATEAEAEAEADAVTDAAGPEPTDHVVLLATDDDDVFDEVDAALGDDHTTVHRLREGKDVRSATAELEPALVILDLQIGNMGGAATATDLRLEEGAGRLPRTAIMLLLDRDDDQFVARRCGADDWIVKPLDSLRLRRVSAELLAPTGV